MKISNVEIAKMVTKKNALYSFGKALEWIDAGRTEEQEEQEITLEEVLDIVENICVAFEIEREG